MSQVQIPITNASQPLPVQDGVPAVSGRVLRPRNVKISYRTALGGEAPQTTLKNRVEPRKHKFKKILNVQEAGSLTFTTEGNRLTPGHWCSDCRNGGQVIVCGLCNLTSICTNCISYSVEDVNSGRVEFECPPCFLQKTPSNPYPFTFQGITSTRQNWPKVLTTPTAIISIHLEGVRDTPSFMTYYHMQPWLQGNLVHVDLEFNFDQTDNDFYHRFDMMLDKFEHRDLQEWINFFVFITSHSDPRTGYIHVGPNNSASVPIGEAILNRGRTNILSLLSCGSLSAHQDSKESIQKLAYQDLFSKIISFSQADFQPSFTHPFVMDLGLHNFVYDRPNLNMILRDHQDLGAHTNIIEFKRGQMTTFMWTHPGLRPMGFSISKQCIECKRLKTLRPTVNSDHSQVTLRCSICKNSRIFAFPTGWKWSHQAPAKGDERGGWLIKVEPVQGQKNREDIGVHMS